MNPTAVDMACSLLGGIVKLHMKERCVIIKLIKL